MTPGISFAHAHFLAGDGEVRFDEAEFTGRVAFEEVSFHRDVHFDRARFSGGELSFEGARLSEGHLLFDDARCAGATFWLKGAVTEGGRIDLSQADSDPCYQDLVPGSSVDSPHACGP